MDKLLSELEQQKYCGQPSPKTIRLAHLIGTSAVRNIIHRKNKRPHNISNQERDQNQIKTSAQQNQHV